MSPSDPRPRAEIPLALYLARLIWLCLLPPALLAGWLAVGQVRAVRSEHERQAESLARALAAAIDQQLNVHIRALSLLAASPLLDDPARRHELYQEARAFHQGLGSHVILADTGRQMLFNTRLPYGANLPRLPEVEGHAAAPTALATGRPAVGDSFVGPIAQEPLVAIAVPALRGGKVAFLLLTILETRRLQESVAQTTLPEGWALSLHDGRGVPIARRGPPGIDSPRDFDAGVRRVADLELAPWRLVLEIPSAVYRAPSLKTMTALASALLVAILAGALGGAHAGRRLGRVVASLADPAAPASRIAEVAAARRLLKESEARERELNADLERRVAERTADLTAANRELDSFAYAVSHDLRAPLRALSGFSQALLEDEGDALDDQARGYLKEIGIASCRMGELIEGLLALSRSTRGALRHDRVDLSALARRLFDELARGETERVVALDLQPGLSARGDGRMLASVLGNLLGNAWKYSAGVPRPAIRVFAETRDGRVWFCVGDNGAGFDMAQADRLFQPFQRLHRRDEPPGLGIGLATARRIVQRHGGTIDARAEKGKGAVFCFTLPEASTAGESV